MNRTGIFL